MNDRYTYRITWSSEDGEHVGLCAEFPSLNWLAPTPEKALSGVRRLVRDIVADMEETGEDPSEPLTDDRSPTPLPGSPPSSLRRRRKVRSG